MAQKAVTVLLDNTLVERIDRLLTSYSADEGFRIYFSKKLKRTDAIRQCLIVGLMAEEARYGITEKPSQEPAKTPKSSRTKPKA